MSLKFYLLISVFWIQPWDTCCIFLFIYCFLEYVDTMQLVVNVLNCGYMISDIASRQILLPFVTTLKLEYYDINNCWMPIVNFCMPFLLFPNPIMRSSYVSFNLLLPWIWRLNCVCTVIEIASQKICLSLWLLADALVTVMNVNNLILHVAF